MGIEELPEPVPAPDVEALCGLLRDCVRGGASLGFTEPVGPGEVEGYWSAALGEAERGDRLILVARGAPGGRIVGCAQLAFVRKPNGRHRAEVQKVMVLPAERRKGVASLLMSAVENAASARNIGLLVLDTSEGKGGARDFYAALGYTYAGGIPGFALDPDGTPVKNAIYYKAMT